MAFTTVEINGKTLLLATNPEVNTLLARILVALRELRRRRQS